MSAEKVIYALLSQASAVTALVGTRIYPLQVPQEDPLPAIAYASISDVRASVPLDDTASSRTETSRIEVSVIAATYPQVKALLPLIRSACHGFRGTVVGVQVGRISAELTGPALRDDDQSLFSQSIDFLVLTYQ